MIEILLVISSCFFGFEFVSLFLKSSIDIYTRLGVGFPFGIIATSWIFYFSNLYFEFSYIHGLTIMAILLTAGTVIHFSIKKVKSPAYFANLYIFFLMVLCPTIFLSLTIFLSMLFEGKYTRGAVYGDLPFHLNIITSFVYGCNSKRKSLFDNVSPFFANEPLAYPVLPDFYSSILIGCFDASLQSSIVLPSLPIGFSIFATLSKIVYLESGYKFSSIIAPWIFMFMGGLGFTQIFNPAIRDEYGVDFVHNWGNQRYEYWFQTLIHFLLPQRLSLFSIPLSFGYIAIMLSIKFGDIEYINHSSLKRLNVKVFVMAGLIVASLAQVQAHSLIALAEWTLMFFLVNFPYKITNYKKAWFTYTKCFVILAFVAFSLGIPQLIPYVGRTKNAKFIKIRPIWKDDKKNFLSLWWPGLGVFFALSIFIAPLTLDKRRFLQYLPSLFVFFVSNFIQYQPWNLDNTKVFNAAWTPLAVAVICHFLSYIYKKPEFVFNFVTTVYLIALCLSGLMGITGAMVNGFPLWDEREDPNVLGDWIKANTEPKSVWATDSFHNHPVMTVAGRQTLVGYRGWLVSHSLDESERIDAINILNIDSEETKGVDELNVTYLCFSKKDRQELLNEPKKTSKKWMKVFETELFIVYERKD